MRPNTTTTAIVMALLPSAALSHHSEAAFDTQTVVAFEGIVSSYAWRNPHVYIYVDTVDASGAAVEWELETGATPILMRSGWTRESLRPGERVRVRGHPERDTPRRYAILIAVEKDDGTVLSQNPRQLTGPQAATTIAGIWKGDQTSVDAFIARFSQIPLTAKALAAQSAYRFQADSPVAQCIAHALPRALFAAGLFLTEITTAADRVAIRSEYFDVERLVVLDGRGHAPDTPRTHQGHSIGRWEDGAFIVDSIRFADNPSASGEGVPSGALKHVVERYSLTAGGTRLRLDVTLEDPEFLSEPFHGHIEFEHAPELELFRYDCDPSTSQRFKLDRL